MYFSPSKTKQSFYTFDHTNNYQIREDTHFQSQTQTNFNHSNIFRKSRPTKKSTLFCITRTSTRPSTAMNLESSIVKINKRSESLYSDQQIQKWNNTMQITEGPIKQSLEEEKTEDQPVKLMKNHSKQLPKTYEEFLKQKQESEKTKNMDIFYRKQQQRSTSRKKKNKSQKPGIPQVILTKLLLEGGIDGRDKNYSPEQIQEQMKVTLQRRNGSYDLKGSFESNKDQYQKRKVDRFQEKGNLRSRKLLEIKKVNQEPEIQQANIISYQQPNSIICYQSNIDRSQPNKKFCDGRWDGLYSIYQQMTDINQKLQINQIKKMELDEKLEILHEYQLIRNNFTYGLQTGLISIEELEAISEEIIQDDHPINYIEIDKIISKNSFFARFQRGVRIGLLESGQFKKAPQGTILIEQGKQVNTFFVVLRGSCSLQQLIQTDEKITDWHNIVSFYEGEHFSETTLTQKEISQQVLQQSEIALNSLKLHPVFQKHISQKNISEVANSRILAQEDLYYFYMQNNKFQQILITSVEKEVQPKLDVLKRVEFLKYEITELLIPLAATIQVENYKIGDYLIKKGDQIERLYIISQGQFKVIIESRQTRELQNQMFVQRPTQMIYKSHLESTSKIAHRKTKSAELQDQHFFCTPPISEQKSYDKGQKIQINTNIMEFTSHIIIKELKIGETVCGRALLSNEEFKNKMAYYQSSLTNEANLSIVVYSTSAEVFSLDFKQFATLPERLQKQLKEGLISEKEFDDCPVKEVQQQYDLWERVKQGYYKNLVFNACNRRKMSSIIN